MTRELSHEELDRVIDELYKAQSPQAFRKAAKDAAGLVYSWKPRYQVFFRGVLMAECVTKHAAERLKKVLLRRV